MDNSPKITSPPDEQQVESDTPFYDVMPKTYTRGPLVAQKLQTPESAGKKKAEENQFKEFLKQHKAVIIIVIILLLLTYPAYYVIKKIASSKSGEETLLSEAALKLLAEEKEKKKKTGEPEQQPAPHKTSSEWQKRFFGADTCQNLERCGDTADPDRDGLKNLDEYNQDTDPNNPDSDQDGLADGDEFFIFGSQPNNPRSAGDLAYNDAEYIKGGYNPAQKDALFTPDEISQVKEKMKTFGLHQPTVGTLSESLVKIYQFTSAGDTPDNATSTPSASQFEGIDFSPEAKQDRDAQRSTTIKNLAIALAKYYDDKKVYPATTDFITMFNEVKPYVKVATNPADPLNKDVYIYTYTSSADAQDFTLTFFSESQNQIIRTRGADAKKYQQQEQAALYDDQRKTHLESLRTALLLYSANRAGGNQEYVFPTKEAYPSVLMPEFISEIPKDPKTNEPYEYQVAETFDSFTLKTLLDMPPTGRTGYLCNQEECRFY